MAWPRGNNYRGEDIPTSIGVIIVGAVLLFTPLLANMTEGGLARLFDFSLSGNRVWAGLYVAVLVTALLGLLDDIYGGGEARGFRGHFRALGRGRVTTGLMKAGGGGLLALALAWWVPVHTTWPQILVDALIIALSINVFNLLDLRPGRVLKAYFLSFLIVGAFGLPYHNPVIWPYSIPIAAAAVGLFSGDIQGRFMLGDAGSNVLGASVGFTIMILAGPLVKLCVLVLLVTLNLVSEKWSFTKIIEAIPPLRWLDNLWRT